MILKVLEKFIKKFEKSFSSFHSKKYGISVSNGTAALEVAIKSLELKKGSEVIFVSAVGWASHFAVRKILKTKFKKDNNL